MAKHRFRKLLVRYEKLFKSLANRQTFYVAADAVARLQNQRWQSVVRTHAQDQQQNYRCTQAGSGHRRQKQYRFGGILPTPCRPYRERTTMNSNTGPA
jgi:hypothetical protein